MTRHNESSSLPSYVIRPPVQGVPDTIIRALGSVLLNFHWAWVHVNELAEGVSPDFSLGSMGKALRDARHTLEEFGDELTEWEEGRIALRIEPSQVERNIINWVQSALNRVKLARSRSRQLRGHPSLIVECRRDIGACNELRAPLLELLADAGSSEQESVFHDFRRSRDHALLQARYESLDDPIATLFHRVIEGLEQIRHASPLIQSTSTSCERICEFVESLSTLYEMLEDLSALLRAQPLDSGRLLKAVDATAASHSRQPSRFRVILKSSDCLRHSLDIARDLRDLEPNSCFDTNEQLILIATGFENAKRYLNIARELFEHKREKEEGGQTNALESHRNSSNSSGQKGAI